MTLILCSFAAIISLIIWYKALPKDDMKIATLCLIYSGASLMWFVDAVFGYIELKDQYFTTLVVDGINDSILGLCVILLGLIIWIIQLFIKDPNNKISNYLKLKSNNY